MGMIERFAVHPELPGEQFPTSQHAACATGERHPDAGGEGQQNAHGCVGECRHVHLTDEAREAAIQLAGEIFIKHMRLWKVEGRPDAEGDARRALRLQTLLIAGRSPAQVERMERERKLNLPACANEETIK